MAELPERWKKPSDVLNLRKYKNLKKSVTGVCKGAHNVVSKLENSNIKHNSVPNVSLKLSLKRKNPFSCETSGINKFKAYGNSGGLSDTPNLSISRHFISIDTSGEKAGTEANSYVDFMDNEGLKAKFNQLPGVTCKRNVGSVLPDDFSLRSKLRFFVPSSAIKKFWPVRGTDEAQGIADFILKTENEDLKQVLQSHLMYWSYPSIPWLKLFPRMDLGKQRIESHDIHTISKSSEDILLNEWLDAMSSCYQNIKQGLSPYMYICCQNMTVLFISSTVSGKVEVIALVTPTTRGLRKSLDDEGIEYELPLLTKYDKKACRIGEHQSLHPLEVLREDEIDIAEVIKKTSVGDDGEESDDDEAWLEKLGLDKKKYQLKECGMSSQTDDNIDFELVDYRPTSVIMMSGINSNAFFNFFVNSSHVVSTIGPLAGIPPTILSPFAFKNSSLRSLMIHNKGEIVSSTEPLNYSESFDDKMILLEIVGPVLPGCFKNICHFFSLNCERYSGIFTVLESSLPFNCLLSDLKMIDMEDRLKYKDKVAELKRSAVRIVEFYKSYFKWE